MKKSFLLVFAFAWMQAITAQVGINTTDPNALLDIRSGDEDNPSPTDGLLIPKINSFPATQPGTEQHGMLVYLTTDDSGNPPGFYYWNSTVPGWLLMLTEDNITAGGGTLDDAYDFGTPGAGKEIIATDGAVLISGTDGLVSTGEFGDGDAAPDGAGVRMVWNPRKAAFRAGRVTGTEWDNANIGNYSTAFGRETVASGNQSTAFGYLTVANQPEATAFGHDTEAGGLRSTAFGSGTTAGGQYSTAFGQGTTASGIRSTAFGQGTTASGLNSTAFGINTTASGTYSTAFGNITTASGNRATAFGESTTASGRYSTAFGNGNTAQSYLETVIGGYATVGAGNATSWVPEDRLFVVGNGIHITARSDALTILKNGLITAPSLTTAMIDDESTGRVLITKEWHAANTSPGGGTLDDAYDFGASGAGKEIIATDGAVLISGTDGLVSTGEFGDGDAAPDGAGVRMVWNPRKAAFRAGRVTGTEWDNANIGNYSTAFGRETVASGNQSTAFGWDTTASGTYSTAFGWYTTASGTTSTAFGDGTTASGLRSTAFGQGNTAQSYLETVIGRFATVGAGNATSWVPEDRLFVVGNGTDTRSNALTMLKNGRIGLQSITNPDFALHLPNSATDGIGRGRAQEWTTYSDQRVKSGVRIIAYGLEEVMRMEPVQYTHHSSHFSEDGKLVTGEGTPAIGFLAQQLYEVVPEIVNKPEDETKSLWGMDYGKLTPVLVKAIQEQQEEIEALKEENKRLSGQVSKLETRLSALEKKENEYRITNVE